MRAAGIWDASRATKRFKTRQNGTAPWAPALVGRDLPATAPIASGCVT